jgi:hypothetical protein
MQIGIGHTTRGASAYGCSNTSSAWAGSVPSSKYAPVSSSETVTVQLVGGLVPEAPHDLEVVVPPVRELSEWTEFCR